MFASIEDVCVVTGDTVGGPYSLGLYGSWGAIVCGGSTTVAAQKVRKKAMAIAAGMLEARVDDIEIKKGKT